jgi:ankyrin repeat protein
MVIFAKRFSHRSLAGSALAILFALSLRCSVAQVLSQQNADAALFDTIDHEDASALHNALVDGASLHALDRYGHTPLVSAAAEGNARIVRDLLAAGADINEADRSHNTPVTQAAFDNQIDVLRVLLQHHANLDAQDARGDTAVAYAVNRRNMEILQLFIEAGANLNLINPNTGHSLLTAAYVDNDDYDFVQALRAAGAHFADATDELFAASAYGDIDQMRHAIDAHADVNFASRFGETALCVAARKGNTAAVRLLLRNGANPAVTGSDHHTALEWALFSEHLSTVETLLDAGADPRAPVSGQRSMLSMAAWGFDDPALLDRFLRAGVDVNARDITRQTALFGAAQAGHEHAAKFLLEHGADPNAADTHGKTAEDYAARNHHEAIVKLIERARKQPPAPSH